MEDSKLFLYDLSCRVAFGVKCQLVNNNYSVVTLSSVSESECQCIAFDMAAVSVKTSDVKPYLRSMSKMTSAEKQELAGLMNKYDVGVLKTNNNYVVFPFRLLKPITSIVRWFYEHHLDVHYLIEQGLALEAPEEMYGYIEEPSE